MNLPYRVTRIDSRPIIEVTVGAQFQIAAHDMELIAVINDAMTELDQPCWLLVDILGMPRLSFDDILLGTNHFTLSRSAVISHPNYSGAVVISRDTRYQVIASTLNQIGSEMKLCRSRAEAEIILEELGV